MGARVRNDEFGYSMEVVGHGDLVVQNTDVFGYIEIAGPAYLYSLRQALVKLRRDFLASTKRPLCLRLSRTPLDEFAPPHGCAVSPSLVLEDDSLFVRLQHWPRTEQDLKAVRLLFAPFLKRHKAKLRRVAEKLPKGPDWAVRKDAKPYLEVTIDWPTKGRTVFDAWEFGREAHALLRAGNNGEITRENALDLLRGKRWNLFRGQRESAWLEAKGVPYESFGEHWRYKLARDVAAFANAPDGGVIVIGMKTKSRDIGDEITDYKELALDLVNRQSYRDVIRDYVYPRVVGFDVEYIEGTREDMGLAIIMVPRQPKASLPFLVRGVLEGGKVLGSHIGIPVRREDDTGWMNFEAVHDRIRLGDQVISGELGGDAEAQCRK